MGPDDLPAVRIVRVFIATPSGLDAEHDAIDELVGVLNDLLEQWSVELKVTRGAQRGPSGQRPQDDINQDVDHCEIFVGIVFDHLGAPSGGPEETGFMEEYERTTTRRGSARWPELMLFFKAVPEAQLDDPGARLSRVIEFKQTFIDNHRPFFFEFQSVEDLAARVRKRLFDLVVERTGIGPEPESLLGERGQRPVAPTGPVFDPPPAAALPPSAMPRLLIDGPLAAVPDGIVREQQAEALLASDPAEAATRFRGLARELQTGGPHLILSAEQLMERSAAALAAAGDRPGALTQLEAVLLARSRRGTNWADQTLHQLGQILSDDQRWREGAWEACLKWPEHPQRALAVLNEVIDQHDLENEAEPAVLYWRLIRAELLQRLDGPREALSSLGDVDSAPDDMSGVLLRLARLDALSTLRDDGAEDCWAAVLERANGLRDAEPEIAATIWARRASQLARDDQVEASGEAFNRAAEIWARVPDASDQVAEMFFGRHIAAEINGTRMLGAWKLRPVAAAMHGAGDNPDSRASTLEIEGLGARVLGNAFDALSHYWSALVEHQRAGNLRGQLYIWHLLGELHEHARHYEDAVRAYVACGREDDAKRVAADALPSEVVEIAERAVTRWERAAGMAAISAVGRRLSEEQSESVAKWLLPELDNEEVSPGPSRLMRATESASAILLNLRDQQRIHALNRLRTLADTPDLRVSRPAAEALMLATNSSFSDETLPLAGAFLNNSEFANISWAWIGARLKHHPEATRLIATSSLDDSDVAFALIASGDQSEPLRVWADDRVVAALDRPAGRDGDGNVIGLLSFEGLGLAGRLVSESRAERLGSWLVAFATSADQPQVNRASAANALINFTSRADPEWCKRWLEDLLPVAAGRAPRSVFDSSDESVSDPFNRIRLGFTAASAYLQAASLEACAGLSKQSGHSSAELDNVVSRVWASPNASVAASAWDACARSDLLTEPPGLEAALVHPHSEVRAAALHCIAARQRDVLTDVIVDRLATDPVLAVRLELIRACKALDRTDVIARLQSDDDVYVRLISLRP